MTSRSSGWGRRRPTGRSRHWVMLEHYLLASPAWRSLSTNAKALYVDLKRLYNGMNNGELAMSSRDAGDLLNASHHTGARALTELQEHGFIAITAKSNFTRKVKLATLYRLTELRDDRPGHEAPPTKEFMKWGVPARRKKSEVSLTGEIDSRRSETDTPDYVKIHA